MSGRNQQKELSTNSDNESDPSLSENESLDQELSTISIDFHDLSLDDDDADKPRPASTPTSGNSSSTGVDPEKSGEPILLTISSQKTSGHVCLTFTAQRPKTAEGKTQDDHVIPHALVIAFCRAIIKDGRLIDAPKNLAAAFEELKTEADFSEFALDEEDLKPYNCSFIKTLRALRDENKQEIEDFISHYKIGIRQQRIEQITKALSDILSTYNRLSDVTAERIEIKKGEGSTVHTALVALEAIDSFLKNPQDTKEFYRKAIEPHGPFVDGMAKIFNLPGIEAVRTQIGAPRKGIKKGEQPSPQIIAAFSKTFEEKAKNLELIGRLIASFFDYPYRADRFPENLNNLVDRCLSMVFKTFSNLGNLNRSHIKKSFITEVAIKQ